MFTKYSTHFLTLGLFFYITYFLYYGFDVLSKAFKCIELVFVICNGHNVPGCSLQ